MEKLDHMNAIADFIRENSIVHDWRGSHFYIWPFFIDMDDLVKLIPWGGIEYGRIFNVSVSEDNLCIDLTEVFEREDIEKYFPEE